MHLSVFYTNVKGNSTASGNYQLAAIMAEPFAYLQCQRGSLLQVLPLQRTHRSYPELQAFRASQVPPGLWAAPGPGILPQESWTSAALISEH